jgi:hypothetical protein
MLRTCTSDAYLLQVLYVVENLKTRVGRRRGRLQQQNLTRQGRRRRRATFTVASLPPSVAPPFAALPTT